jgi:hypothetical protein
MAGLRPCFSSLLKASFDRSKKQGRPFRAAFSFGVEDGILTYLSEHG